MTNMKHTPGPWEIEKRPSTTTGSVHYAVKTAYNPAAHLHSPRFITFMCGALGDYHPARPMDDYRDDPGIEADARLIAAAPELLEALREARYILIKRGLQESTTFGIVEAAIAKAEGGAA